jgi:hypothetical protein
MKAAHEGRALVATLLGRFLADEGQIGREDPSLFIADVTAERSKQRSISGLEDEFLDSRLTRSHRLSPPATPQLLHVYLEPRSYRITVAVTE